MYIVLTYYSTCILLIQYGYLHLHLNFMQINPSFIQINLSFMFLNSSFIIRGVRLTSHSLYSLFGFSEQQKKDLLLLLQKQVLFIVFIQFFHN